MASSNNHNVNHPIETPDVRDAFIQVNEAEEEKKRQAEELAQLKDQVATLHRLVQGQLPAQPVAPVIQKKHFTGIKVYGKEPQYYRIHDHLKYDNYVYEMEKVFKSNEGLEEAKDPEHHKVAFATSYLKDGPSQVWRTKERVGGEEAKYTWKDVKDTLLKHVPRAKSLQDDTYLKWKSAKQSDNQPVNDYHAYVSYLESHLPDTMKPTETQQLSNFRSGLRLDHQQKLKNLPEKTDLQDLLDQVMSFEEGESLGKAHKKGKHSRGANPEGQEDNQEENDSKRHRSNDSRGRGRGSSSRGGRGGSRESYRGGRGRGSNPNREAINYDKVYEWFDSLSLDKQNELRDKHACFCCGGQGHSLYNCPKNPFVIERKKKEQEKEKEKSKN